MRSPGRHVTPAVVAVLGGFSVVAAACGSDDPTTEADADRSAPTTDTDMNEEVHTDPDMEVDDEASDIGDPMDDGFSNDVPDEDLRIVSLSPTATETLFAIGAGEQLVVVDVNSNFPAEALELPNELDAFEPSVEAIADFEPDLVLIGGDFTGLGDQLTTLDIEFLDLPPATSLDDAYGQIERLGEATGHAAEATDVVESMQDAIVEIANRVDIRSLGLTYYHEISPDLFTADSSTFIGELYSLLGLENIADMDDSESFGFPQLNAEFVIEQNPDVIFLPTGTFAFTTADDVASRPGWDAIAAVRDGLVIETDDEIGGRWGPRIVDYLDSVQVALEDAGRFLTPEGG